MANAFWENKSVLITGAGGFVGGHLKDFLLSQGARVLGISRKSKDSAILPLDIGDKKQLENLFKKQEFFACFHLAADAIVEEGQESPYETIRNNVTGALNILELGRLYKTQRIIIASSVHVYGDQPVPFVEDNPPQPSRPYETSKTCVDIIAQTYADSYNLPVVIPRFVNIYGPGDLNFTRLIPKTIRNILLGKNPTLWDGSATREYLYIDDVLRAYQKLAQIPNGQLEKNRIFNFGSHQGFTARAIMNRIMDIANTHLEIKKISHERVNEIAKQRVSWEKAKRILRWKPITAFNTGLRQTIEWYRDYFKIS